METNGEYETQKPHYFISVKNNNIFIIVFISMKIKKKFTRATLNNI